MRDSKVQAIPIPHKEEILIKSTNTIIKTDKTQIEEADIKNISIQAIHSVKRKHQRETGKPIGVLRVGLKDIEKALQGKTYPDPRTALPEQYQKFADVFSPKAANTLPPHRNGMD